MSVFSGAGGKGDTLKGSFLVVDEVPDRGGTPLAGLAATEDALFVSDPNTGEIKVFDCETLQRTRSWPIERTGPLAIDRWGNLAMLQAPRGDEPQRVLLFGRGEKPLWEASMWRNRDSLGLLCQAPLARS